MSAPLSRKKVFAIVWRERNQDIGREPGDLYEFWRTRGPADRRARGLGPRAEVVECRLVPANDLADIEALAFIRDADPDWWRAVVEKARAGALATPKKRRTRRRAAAAAPREQRAFDRIAAETVKR